MQLDLLRTFFTIAEHGSLNRAAELLHVSQSTLTRQMNALEQDLGGRLLERGPNGVSLTPAGQALIELVEPVLNELEQKIGEVRNRARGQSSELRIGYLMSAVAEYLHPALAVLRTEHPQVKVRLLDMSPGEQIRSLKEGTIDLALIGQTGSLINKDYYVRRIATLPVGVAMSCDHALAKKEQVWLGDLKKEFFIGAKEEDKPGFNRWITQICRKAGFKARFFQDSESLNHALSLVVLENAVTIVPDCARSMQLPGIEIRTLSDPGLQWELLVAWSGGKLSAPMKTLLEALPNDSN